MKIPCQSVKKQLHNQRGMTLTELLVALAIMTIAIICFLPLMQSSFRNIYTAGEKTKDNYHAVGLIERLIGNTGANGAYETTTADVPLVMKSATKAIQANTGSLQEIKGVSISSRPDNIRAGFTTFICDSVTAKMVCYPTHISDDFLKKEITLYASGFRFSSVNQFEVFNTDKNGQKQPVPGPYTKDNRFIRIEIDKDNSSIAHMTLIGDNDKIRFENSPLLVQYGSYQISIEIDAPTVIMVGEQAADGQYYYYVTSGEVDKDGNMDIIRKRMNGSDPRGQLSDADIPLRSAMNDVEWVEVGEGDDGAGGDNTYGYYVMCGDEGQIRRFWKNPKNGNYGWGGDYTINHEYYWKDNKETVKDTKMYSTTVNSMYIYEQNPTKNLRTNTDLSMLGKNLIPRPAGDTNNWSIWDSLYTQKAFTINALQKYNLDVYTAGNLLFVKRRTDIHGSNAWDEVSSISDRYLNRSSDSGWMKLFKTGRDYNGGTWNNALAATGNVAVPPLSSYAFNDYNATVLRRANDMRSFQSYYGLDKNSNNYITLTSVDSVKMTKAYSSPKHPTQSYTLYCGYIPAVMDVWAMNKDVPDSSSVQFGKWRATLGIAFEDNEKETIQVMAAKYFHDVGPILRGWVKSWGIKYYMDMDGYVWRYADADTKKNFALSGICGPDNYNPVKTRALTDTLALAKKRGFNKELYPLNTCEMQNYVQKQNKTFTTMSYLSNPYALQNRAIERCAYPQSPDRKDMDGVFEWAMDDSTTIMDSDSLYYEDYDGNSGYYSIAVGYYVGGLAYDDYNKKAETHQMVATPTVMNNGIVFLRAGGANDDGLGNGFTLQQESNVFNRFYGTNNYWRSRNAEVAGGKNTLHLACSAGYWRDAYHPLFYSTFGGTYDPNDAREKYSFIMGHILQDKQLQAVSWGTTWQECPEAMWGASDGTLMSWDMDLNILEKGPDHYNHINMQSIVCEFQSYQRLKYCQEHYKKYSTTKFSSRWTHPVSGGVWGEDEYFYLPKNTQELTEKVTAHPWSEASYENAYWDKCSIELQDINTYGFLSPLDTIEDVEFANDTWVAAGIQGLANPKIIPVDGFDTQQLDGCKDAAVAKTIGYSNSGSWVCVRTWLDRSGGADKGPVKGNDFFRWQAVQISTVENCNIQQVTYCNGRWYAVGYIDTNNNNRYDYTVAPGQEREHAVVFSALDPSLPCGTQKGWQMSDPGKVGYTQIWANDGNGQYKLMDLDGVNAVASRNT